MSQSDCVGVLTEGALLDEDAEDVGDVLVEGAGLVLVVQARGVLRDAVRQLVPDDVEAAGEPQEDLRRRRRRTPSATPSQKALS